MKAFIDCGSGVAGGMILGALIGLGLSPHELERTLKLATPIKNWRLEVIQEERQMWPAWTLKVKGDRPYSSQNGMLSLIQKAPLPKMVRDQAHAILTRIQRAEEEAHGYAHGHFDPKGLGR